MKRLKFPSIRNVNPESVAFRITPMVLPKGLWPLPGLEAEKYGVKIVLLTTEATGLTPGWHPLLRELPQVQAI